MANHKNVWTPKERRLLESLYLPEKIQSYLDRVDYDPEGGIRSPRVVMREGRANCFSGAVLGAAAMMYHGDPPVLVELAAVSDDDHMLAVFRRGGSWGAVAKSNTTVLRFREPVYRSLRELVMSYFDFYFNTAGEKTLRSYSRPLDLRVFDGNWMTAEENPDYIEDALVKRAHYKILAPGMSRKLSKASPPVMKAGFMGSNKKGLYKPKE